MADQKKIPQRSEIPVEHTWDTSAIYPTDTAWEKEFDETQALVRTLPQYAGRLGESAQTLYDYLDQSIKISDRVLTLARYACLRQDEDTRVGKYQAMAGKGAALWVELTSATAFDTPELLKLSRSTLEQFYAEKRSLALYRRFFTVLQDKKEHILSDAEEKLLAAAGEMAQAPDEIFSKFANADLTFPDAVDGEGNCLPLSNATYVTYEMSEDRALRRSAYEKMYDTLGQFQNTAAALLDAGCGEGWYTAALAQVKNIESNPNIPKGQKLALMMEQLAAISNAPIQLVILGSGESKIEDAFRELENSNKGKIAFYKGYNESLAHRIYAASDLFLMPSLFEPCGLSQLCSLRYATLPLVRETGGLKDTVAPYNEYDKSGNGFSFAAYNANDLVHTLYYAADVFYNRKEDWDTLMTNALNSDVSWEKSARTYSLLYNELMGQ